VTASVREALTTGWALLAGGGPGSREWRALRIDLPHALDVFAAIREGDGTRAILFECPIAAAPSWRMRFESEGLALTDERDASDKKMRVSLALERADLESIALVIADDLVESSAEAAHAAEAITAVAARLTAWQTCLERRKDGFGRERMLGLFGELVVLERLASAIGFDRAIGFWSGPNRGLHDFEAAGEAIEVKTSAGSSGLVRVHSLDQLDDAGLRALTLCRVVVVPDDQGVDLDGIVSRVRATADALGHPIRRALDTRLLMTGYVGEHGRADRLERLGVSTVEGYRIQDGFPRVTRSGVPLGIVAASYNVDPAAADAFKMTDDVLAGIFGSFGTGAT